MIFTLPIRLVSVANQREHWAKRAKRTKSHRGTAKLALAYHASRVPLPVDICITRVAPRMLDMDNCVASMKAIQDGIADAFCIKDNDPRIRFEYAQERGKPKEYAVKIQVIVRLAAAEEG